MNSQAKQRGLYPLVISHYLASAIFFVILSLMLFLSTKELAGHYFHPRLLAITHMAALGWGTLIIFGAAYQLLPVVFETELASIKMPWISFVLFLAGLAQLVWSFWEFSPGRLMQSGGLLILLAILLFAITVFRTSQQSAARGNIQQKFIVTSCLWLFLTALLGVLLVFNFNYPFLPKDHLSFLKLHAHMGIGGWFLMLIIGVSAKLIPMFLVSTRQNERLLRQSYYLCNAALLLFLTDTYLWGINRKTAVIALLLLAGLLCYAGYIVTCFRSRLKKQIELPIANTILSFILMGLAVVVLPFVIHYHLKGDPRSIHYTTLYGSLLFMGWISALILGQTFKTLPFIVWVQKYEHLAGKQKTPLPADLYKQWLLQLQTGFFLSFCFLFFVGCLFKLEVLMGAGIACLILTSLAYTINLAAILLHRSKTIHHERL
ncbi:hypothetical protein [Arcticibacter sp. MXS-1]|uniref:hypothetical protein n=1 Tax=Arcticibacter sp. MXS-1 TaxID=3341726 RepID=UPI0035A8C25E